MRSYAYKMINLNPVLKHNLLTKKLPNYTYMSVCSVNPSVERTKNSLCHFMSDKKITPPQRMFNAKDDLLRKFTLTSWEEKFWVCLPSSLSVQQQKIDQLFCQVLKCFLLISWGKINPLRSHMSRAQINDLQYNTTYRTYAELIRQKSWSH